MELELHAKAEAGDIEAQYDIAFRLMYGEGVKKNKKEAVRWYLKAAKHGHAQAQESLGHAYRHGLRVKESPDKAIQWFRKAANQGVLEAQRNLAELISDINLEEGASWYQLAAEAGDPQSQFKSAKFYEEGKGVPKNDSEAFRWYLSAELHAKENDADVGLLANPSYEVGRCYSLGLGVRKDSDEALKRLLPIANPKITADPWLMSRAQLWVATVFADPEHARHDLVEAYAWFSLAAAYAPSGEEVYGETSRESAAEFRDIISAKLSKEQLGQAQVHSKDLFLSRREINKRLNTI